MLASRCVVCSYLFLFLIFFLLRRPPLLSTLFPYTTLFRSLPLHGGIQFLPFRCSAKRSWPMRFAICPGRSTENLFAMPSSVRTRSEEHTSELQSRFDLVCRLLLEKKKTIEIPNNFNSHILS